MSFFNKNQNNLSTGFTNNSQPPNQQPRFFNRGRQLPAPQGDRFCANRNTETINSTLNAKQIQCGFNENRGFSPVRPSYNAYVAGTMHAKFEQTQRQSRDFKNEYYKCLLFNKEYDQNSHSLLKKRAEDYKLLKSGQVPDSNEVLGLIKKYFSITATGHKIIDTNLTNKLSCVPYPTEVPNDRNTFMANSRVNVYTGASSNNMNQNNSFFNSQQGGGLNQFNNRTPNEIHANPVSMNQSNANFASPDINANNTSGFKQGGFFNNRAGDDKDFNTNGFNNNRGNNQNSFFNGNQTFQPTFNSQSIPLGQDKSKTGFFKPPTVNSFNPSSKGSFFENKQPSGTLSKSNIPGNNFNNNQSRIDNGISNQQRNTNHDFFRQNSNVSHNGSHQNGQTPGFPINQQGGLAFNMNNTQHDQTYQQNTPQQQQVQPIQLPQLPQPPQSYHMQQQNIYPHINNNIWQTQGTNFFPVNQNMLQYGISPQNYPMPMFSYGCMPILPNQTQIVLELSKKNDPNKEANVEQDLDLKYEMMQRNDFNTRLLEIEKQASMQQNLRNISIQGDKEYKQIRHLKSFKQPEIIKSFKITNKINNTIIDRNDHSGLSFTTNQTSKSRNLTDVGTNKEKGSKILNLTVLVKYIDDKLILEDLQTSKCRTVDHFISLVCKHMPKNGYPEEKIISNSELRVNNVTVDGSTKLKDIENIESSKIIFVINLSINGVYQKSSKKTVTLNEDDAMLSFGKRKPVVNAALVPKFTKKNYVIHPPIMKLARMSEEELKNVENFTVSNEHGKIEWLGVTDLTCVDIDLWVIIKKDSVEVYPEDIFNENTKHPEGTKLNKPCIVTLYKMFPRNKKRKANFEEDLEKTCIDQGAQHISYNKESGEWKFKVFHYTKYCFDDGESEVDIKYDNRCQGNESHQYNKDAVGKYDAMSAGNLYESMLNYANAYENTKDGISELSEENIGRNLIWINTVENGNNVSIDKAVKCSKLVKEDKKINVNSTYDMGENEKQLLTKNEAYFRMFYEYI